MVKQVKRVVIVGGGTAGWLTAGVIAARHQGRIKAGTLSVSVLESPDVPIIGVGEGTWPTLRTTLQKIGIAEADFFRECDAAFKQGAKFARWTTGAEDDWYYHPLVMPQGFTSVNLAPHWLANDGGLSFCDAVCTQGEVCEQGLAPKLITTPEYQGLVNYAYHLDAGKLSVFLTKHCKTNLGVQHILATVTSVNLAENGDIASLSTIEAGDVEGDFFVDCTGFASLLLGQALEVPFRDCNDVLFCNTALAVQVPYPEPDAQIASHTISTAQSSGWIWDIGLPTRRGVGHVYSSDHITDAQAEDELAAYVGPAIDGLSVRKISIRSGHRTQRWKNNCVAVGMAAGFLEPLEASAIVLVEISANWIAEQLPTCREVMDIVSQRFNDVTDYHWGRIIDFLKLHYVLTKRRDSQFWIDNVDPKTIPERLQHLMLLWEHQGPWFKDEFDRIEEMFPAASYQYVLYGMGFKTLVQPEDLIQTQSLARRALMENQSLTQKMVAQLPPNRELLDKIRQFGLQTV